MYFKQSELFLGTSMDFVQKFMDISQMSSHAAGDILFRENDPAEKFYILIDGSVKLTVGEPAHTVYNAQRNGEAFGWSSLIDRDIYSASAECVAPSKLLITGSRQLSTVLSNDPSNAVIFFRQLAATLGNRLLESYKMIAQEDVC